MPVAIPVLMYHHINPHRGDTVTVLPETFAAQMHYLAAEGYRTLSIKDLLDHVSGLRPVREKSVLLTFDDGWLDNYLFAIPLLEDLRFRAAFFVITARADDASVKGCNPGECVPPHEESKRLIASGAAEQVVLDWGLIKILAQKGLFEFHSHMVTHRPAAALGRNELTAELRESKLRMEQKLGLSCPYLCWPYGSFTDETVQSAIESGYEALFTTCAGFTLTGADRFRLKRFEVRDDMVWFKELLAASVSI